MHWYTYATILLLLFLVGFQWPKNKRFQRSCVAQLSPGSFGPVVKEMSFKIFLTLASVAICLV